MAIRTNHITIGRVVSQDDDFVMLEVPKSITEELHIEQGDEFLTVIFVRNRNGAVESWNPWAAGGGDNNIERSN